MSYSQDPVISNMDMQQAGELLREWAAANSKVLILCHAHPDGDTLGSGYALCEYLQRAGAKAMILCEDPLPPLFSYLKDGITEQKFEPDRIISVDVADKELLGKYKKYGDMADMAIDHHLSHVPFAENRLVTPEAAATAEIVFTIINNIIGYHLTETMAAALYTGIATDTGCFRYANTTPDTHRIASMIMEQQSSYDWGGMNYRLFDMKSRARLQLEQRAISSMEFFCDGKGALILLTKEMLDTVGPDDVNGLVALPRMVEGVEVGISLRQVKDGWKASLRSNGNIDVQEICRIFGGGGHKRAAGCTLKGTVEESKQEIIKAVTEVLERL